jgi:hypothetical protein
MDFGVVPIDRFDGADVALRLADAMYEDNRMTKPTKPLPISGMPSRHKSAVNTRTTPNGSPPLSRPVSPN